MENLVMEKYASPLMNNPRAYNSSVNPSFFGTLPRLPSMTLLPSSAPPLLPLPINILDRSSSVLPPAKNSAVVVAAGLKPKDSRRPKRKAKRDKKRVEVQKPVVAAAPEGDEEEVFFFMAPQKSKEDEVVVVLEEVVVEEEEEEDKRSDQSYGGSLYSISPPPNCLPLPKFFLEKPCKPPPFLPPPAKPSFTIEVRGHNSGASATAHLRRLLGI